MNPPPAAQIRRRGDSRRRRSTALISVAAAAAVVAVVVPIGLALGGSPSAIPPATNGSTRDPSPSDPTPSTTESASDQVTTVPADFDLLAGWDTEYADPRLVAPDSDEATGFFFGIDNCSAPIDFVADATDLQLAVWEVEDYVERRTLVVLPDAESAADRFDQILDQSTACDSMVMLEKEFDVDSTDYAVATFGMKFDTFAAGSWVLYRAGNALMVVGAYYQGGEVTDQVLHDSIDLPADQSFGVWQDQMCVFTSQGCSSTASGDGADDVAVPAWNPQITAPDLNDGEPAHGDRSYITVGFPESHEPGTDGVQGPTVSTTVNIDLCDSGFTSSAKPTQGLTASYSNVEDSRVRNVLVFDSDADAESWMGDLRSFVSSCPVEEPAEDGSSLTHAGIDLAVGDDGFGLRSVAVLDGNLWGTGQRTLTVVRLGSAVVLDDQYGEGAWADQSSLVQRQLDDQSWMLTTVQASYRGWVKSGQVR